MPHRWYFHARLAPQAESVGILQQQSDLDKVVDLIGVHHSIFRTYCLSLLQYEQRLCTRALQLVRLPCLFCYRIFQVLTFFR
jgi:hypothetical protein